uniref:Uncharacterized protein n=1 Tax=Quercus lobata TaxID=97700 RepID=A0A7N2RCW9_QUELO
MMWRVGDGTQIRVFHDKWIPRCFPNGAIPRIPSSEDDSTVSSLINQTTMEWNGELIDFKVAPFMAQQIKAIPLCKSVMRDCLVWPRTRDENYLVKTGYQLLEELENRGEASGSNSSNLRSFWKGIWKMRIPNKIKKLLLASLYRVLTNLGEPPSTQCGKLSCVQQLQLEQRNRFACTMGIRNKCHFKEQCLPPEKIVDAAEAILKEFQAKPKNMPMRLQPQPQRWSPPEPDMYKANHDRAYFAEEEAAGIGVVVRNELG